MEAIYRWHAKYVPAVLLAMSGMAVQAQDAPAPVQGEPFRSNVELVTTDVVVRDNNGQFIADLSKDDFEVFEDGVSQKVISFSLTHGGRSFNLAAPPPAPVAEGIILPAARPAPDAAGRIFLIFVDDLHLDFRNTGRIKDLFKKIAQELIHEGDMFGIVSTGPSSLSIDLTYDRKRLDEAIKKISGAGLAPKDILDVPEGSQGPPEVRHRAHVAFSTARDMMRNLEQV
ncbi:MAG: VWA domain-containing protein, partial [Acidobacteria bacterium]|nr:VWA domain-containing protein [Acidobacteriota bacterium]